MVALPETALKTVHTGYRYRLELLPHQEGRLRSLTGSCRWLWNFFLHFREDAYLAARAAGGSLPPGAFTYNRNAARLTELRSMIPWLAAGDITSQQQTLMDLQEAFTNFFQGKSGYPKPRRHDDCRMRVCGKASFAVDGDWVRLPKVGWLRFRKSRDLPKDGRIMNVTVAKDGPHWYVSFCVEHKVAPASLSLPPVGLDLGVKQSVAMTTGEVIHYRVATAKETFFLKRLARQVSRKEFGSNRRHRAVERLAKQKRHYANRVVDDQHKLTARLATTHTDIHAERLQTRNMTASAAGDMKKPGSMVKQKSALNRSILANAPGRTLTMLAYKCARYGSTLHLKDPAYTSQECAECHHITPENRPSQSVFRCVACGHEENADLNAARVVLSRPAAGSAVAARRGKHQTPSNRRSPVEARTQPRDPKRLRHGSTGILGL